MEFLETAFKWLFDHVIGVIVGAAMGTGIALGMRWANRLYWKNALRQDIQNAYSLLRAACEPGTLHPDHPGNPTHIKAEARDAANLLTNRLKKARFYPPPLCTVDEHSLKMWYAFLEQVRIEIS